MSGGGGNTKSTVYQSSLPQYAQPYYESLMDRAQNESNRPYQPYEGQRLAGESNATQQGLQMATNYANSGTGSIPYAQQMAATAGNQAAQLAGYQAGGVNNTYTGPVGGNYQAGTFTNSYTGPEGYTGGDFANQNVGVGTGPYGYSNVTSNDFNQAAAQQYMSPYIQTVLQQQEADEAMRTAQEQTQRNAQASAAGAFGGSRAAVQNQMAINDSQKRMQELVAQGLQSAYENAQSQFNADRGANLQAQLANQQAGLSAAQGNQQGNLQAQQYGEQSRQFGYSTDEAAKQKAADLGLQAQQLGEQSRQYGFDANNQAAQQAAQLGQQAQQSTEQLRQSGKQLGLQGLQQQNQSAELLGQLQSQQDALMLQHLQAQLGVGQTQENYTQQQLDEAYNDFVNQRDSNRQNLQFLSSLLQGVPISANQDVTQSSSGNNLTGALGTLTGLQALYQLGQS
jgi:hypothetical protein